jgi:hypothetical protein
MPYMVPQERESGTVIWGGDDLGLLYSCAGAIRCDRLYSVATSAGSRPAASAAGAGQYRITRLRDEALAIYQGFGHVTRVAMRRAGVDSCRIGGC